MPGKIEALETEIARLQARLGDAGLFAKDPAGFEKAAARIEAAQGERDAAEEEWLTLEMLREELEG